MSPSRVAVAVGCVLVGTAAGCSSHSAEKLPSSTPVAASAPVTTIRGELIPGIGATRAGWDAAHTLNPANNNGAEYGDGVAGVERQTGGGDAGGDDGVAHNLASLDFFRRAAEQSGRAQANPARSGGERFSWT